MRVQGQDFDASRVSPDTRTLGIYTVRKLDLPRLQGLAGLNITHLELRWISAPDFAALSLPKTLEHLTIWHSPKLKSFAGIEQCPKLRTVCWWDTGTLEEATPLSELDHLCEVRLVGGMNDKQRVNSLEFLRGLALERLQLRGIRPHDLDVAPLLELRSLNQIGLLGSDWDIENLARLAARFPAVQADLHDLKPYPLNLGMTCPRCKQARVQLWLRKRKFLWCADCDANGLKKTLDKFDEMVEAARQSGVQPLPDVKLFEE